MQPRTITLISIILAVVLFRFLPHPPNVSPVAAMALFGGAYLADRRLAFVLPFAVMLLSDLFLGLHDTLLYVYGAFAITVAIGLLLRERVGVTSVTLATVGASLTFFLITNFGVWFAGGHGYPMDAAGLTQTFVAGLPFLQYSLLGNLFFAAVMFGGFHLLRSYAPSLTRTA